VVELCPARRSKEFREAVAGLAPGGRTTPRGAQGTRFTPVSPCGISATKAPVGSCIFAAAVRLAGAGKLKLLPEIAQGTISIKSGKTLADVFLKRAVT
jgi:hypothetical protein